MKKWLLLLLLTPVAFGAGGYPPDMPGARVETYKTIGPTQLKLWIYSPQGHQATNRCAAIVFFFGGGWTSGSPQQFAEHCQHLAKRGMVAIAADYRVASRQQAKPIQCIADARSAVRWVRAHAAGPATYRRRRRLRGRAPRGLYGADQRVR
ncbi:MAG: alpha/beta hydrolase [Kiritimatiellaeota bacterium]|nr:alpha/beta hydrolase [Kiritimatiellota bacterium]